MQIEIDGYNIHYNIKGDGKKSVIILQGWGTKSEIYEVVVNALCDRYRVISLDLPGFGSSTEPREAWGVDDYKNFVVKFAKALDTDSAVLIGHSFGGRIIIKLAAEKNPALNIEKIVLIDSAGIVNPKSFKTKLKIARYKVLKKLAGLKIANFFFGQAIEEWKKRQGSDDYRNASPIMKQCLVKAVNENLKGLLPEIDRETLLIWGDKDTATPLSDGKAMEKLIPGAGLAVIPGTGHFSFLENPELFKKIINAFL
ncbi:MAG: alpha/beta hydrolase [Lachnospiraceae bacterium]|nr:alpha/beta hydrolase [Lachnospiraceae bacterium]